MSTVEVRILELEERHQSLDQRLALLGDNPELGENQQELVQVWREHIGGARARYRAPVRVAFLAQVGRGKSTLISVATRLRLDEGDSPEDWSVLPVGEGRTTLGEVRIQVEDRADVVMEVTPVPEELMRTEVRYLAEDVWSTVRGKASKAAESGTVAGEELYGLLRAWLEPEASKRRETLKAWAEAETDLRTLTESMTTRLDLSRRCQALTRGFTADLAGREALKETLRALMAGELPDAPAPRSTVLRLPRALVVAPVDEVIDTQGLESNATELMIRARPDLQRLFAESDIAFVVCSEYVSAPDNVSLELLKVLTTYPKDETAPERAIRVLIVDNRQPTRRSRTDDRHNEKIEVCRDKLRREGLLDRLPPDHVVSLDARREQETLDRLLEGIAIQCREIREKGWRSLLDAAEQAMAPLSKHEHAARLRELDLRIRWAWEVEIGARPALSSDPLAMLAQLIQQREPWISHWSHIHAAVRRRGRYSRLDLIELGARMTASLASSRERTANTRITQAAEHYQITPHNDAEAAHIRMRLDRMSVAAEAYRQALYQAWAQRLNEYLQSPAAFDLWTNCLLRWGQGSGYVLAISDLFREEGQKARLRLTPTRRPRFADTALPPRVHLIRLSAVELNNFRCVESREAPLTEVAVFVGDNGLGKTAWLEAIVAGLGVLLPGMDAGEAPSLREADIRQVIREIAGTPDHQTYRPMSVTLTGQIQGLTQQWSRGVDHGAEEGDGGSEGVRRIAAAIGDEVRDGRSRPLPVLAYYGTQRLWPRDLEPEDRKVGNRQEGYRDCLIAASTHQQMLSWVRDFTLSELQHKRPVPQLRAIEWAVTRCVKGARRFYFDVVAKELRLTMDDGKIIPFSMLSDGYRNIVAMVADIAWRASVLNPELRERAPQLAEGVVLIDEIDLHLHPRWQRHVLADLRRAFPRLQFIATTHSPFIIQSLQPGQLINLDPDADPDALYADQSPEDITENVMGVPLPQRSARREQAAEVAEEYYQLLDQIPGADPARLAALKARLDDLLAPYNDNPAFTAFLVRKRLLAEAGHA